MDYSLLISHYYNNYKSKVFLTELTATGSAFYIMFIYDYDNEIENFSQTFLKYLPFYVRNADYFSAIDNTVNIDNLLESRSKSLRKIVH